MGLLFSLVDNARHNLELISSAGSVNNLQNSLNPAISVLKYIVSICGQEAARRHSDIGE